MKAQLLVLSALVISAALATVLSDPFAEEARLQEATPVIDAAVLQALENEQGVEVLISLKELEVPLADQTTADRRQNAAERQARVLSALAPSDFTLTHQFEIAAALGGRITQSGVDKLATHPDVVAVDIDAGIVIDVPRPIGDKAANPLP